MLGSLTTANRKSFDVSGDVKKGVVVMEVDRRSAAAAAGLRPGDVLVEVGREPVNSAKDVQKQVERTLGAGVERVLLLVRGGEATSWMTLEK